MLDLIDGRCNLALLPEIIDAEHERTLCIIHDLKKDVINILSIWYDNEECVMFYISRIIIQFWL